VSKLDRLVESDRGAVDELVGAEAQHVLCGGASRPGPIDVGVPPACQLGRELAYTARRAVDKHPLTLPQPAVLE
jgi:hypothetical protein